MAGVKNPISFLDLDRAKPTATLLEKVFRDATDYTKEIDSIFDAVVLTQPTLASREADVVISNAAVTQEEKDVAKRSSYRFIVRILGQDSPHNLLPDPTDFYLTDDPECQERYHNLLRLHTLVAASGVSALDLPEVGDTVQINLSRTNLMFNTAVSKDYKGVKVKAVAQTGAVKEKAKKLNQNAKKSFKKSKIKRQSGAGKSPTSYYRFIKNTSVLEPVAKTAFDNFFEELRTLGYKVTITSTKRSVKHQWNYRTGRLKSAGLAAKPCYSDHQYGFALDLNFTDPEGLFISKQNTKDGIVKKSDWQKTEKVAKKHGIAWQGMKDPVHFYHIEGNKSEEKKKLVSKCIAIYEGALGDDYDTWPETFKDLPEAIAMPVDGNYEKYIKQVKDSVQEPE